MSEPQATVKRGGSCFLCQQRKVRCDKKKPCSTCVRSKVECRPAPAFSKERRRRQMLEDALLARLKAYEKLLTEKGIAFEPMENQVRGDQKEDTNQDDSVLRDESPSNMDSPGSRKAEMELVSGRQVLLKREYTAAERILQDDSDDEHGESFSFYNTFDVTFSSPGPPDLALKESQIPLSQCHPDPVQILQHWQIYVDSINPLLRLSHIPTIQGDIIKAASNIQDAPKNIETLMFVIYLITVVSLEESEAQRIFHQPRGQLIDKYHNAAQRALSVSGFMHVDDLILLQAYVLFLFAIRWFVDPRQVSCLTCLAVRIAQRMGLHRDAGQFGTLPPFEVEQRRRLWWAIVHHDRRIGEQTGLTLTALSTPSDCKLPLNVNDSELHVNGTETPSPHSGPTEMIFALTRLEISTAVLCERKKSGSNTEKTAMVQRVGQSETVYTIDDYCSFVEATYLRRCDAKIPLHYFAVLTTRQSCCRLRVLEVLGRTNYYEHKLQDEAEREAFFIDAIKMIEYDNTLQSAPALQPFRWYTTIYFPFPGYMALLLELRERTMEPLVERAWAAIEKNQLLRGNLHRQPSLIHLTFGVQLLKLWDRHAGAVASDGRKAEQPSFLKFVREYVEAKRSTKDLSLQEQDSACELVEGHDDELDEMQWSTLIDACGPSFLSDANKMMWQNPSGLDDVGGGGGNGFW